MELVAGFVIVIGLVETMLLISLCLALIGGIAAVGGKYYLDAKASQHGTSRPSTRALATRNVGIVLFLTGIVTGAIIIALQTE